MKEADLKALRDAAQNTVYGDKGCDLEAFHSLATPPVILALISHIENLEKKLDEIVTSEISPKAWLNNLTGKFAVLMPCLTPVMTEKHTPRFILPGSALPPQMITAEWHGCIRTKKQVTGSPQ